MRNANILQILMSLFYEVALNFDDDHDALIKITSENEIKEQLQKAGLSAKELNLTMKWLENFSQPDKHTQISYQQNAIRVFSAVEKNIIPENCLDLLAQHYQAGDINATEFEFILNQIIELDADTVTEEQFMWVYDMTMANRGNVKDKFINDTKTLEQERAYPLVSILFH
ncbi:DUF494 family protein [Facilibium subflavum]|uniref:DUF494 family protein n=1 Tax=Facilibium subflavum TaxID=2219058 RepID=UPI000E65C1A6|nr:DUF494 family protein [Facilibium subflavum]